MHEYLDFHIGGLAHRADLVQRQFARQDHAVEALLGQQVAAARRSDVHLGGGVQFQLRKVVARHFEHAQVLHDDTVRPHAVQVLQHLPDAVGLALLEHGVHRDVHFLLAVAAGVYGGLELVEGEIGRAHARVEAAQAEIDGVGAFADGCVERFGVAGRSQEFYGFHVHLYTVKGRS